MKWTMFMDMHSGGSLKLKSDQIWIEAPEEEAVDLFEGIFGRDPHYVTCSCCGSDYWIFECDEAEVNDGDIVVSKADIERFRGGLLLEQQS